MKYDKAGIGWIFKMAARDARASKGRLMLFMASMILGIAAVVAIQSFSVTLRENIALQSKSLMGADFIIDSDKPLTDRANFIMDSLGGANAKETSFASMAAFPNSPSTKLVQVRGIEGGFPFYGEITTDPIVAADNYVENNTALVDATVMLQLGLRRGDSIKLGELTLPIEGALKSVSGSSSLFSSVAPPVIIPNRMIERTKLIQIGSRVTYKYYFEQPQANMDELDEKLGWQLDAEGADIDTHTSTSQRMGRRYDNFGKFLNLVAFIALLLGCVGIASAISIYIKQKLKSVAVLKCLGATKMQTFKIFLFQIGVMGLIGGAIGTFLGFILQQLFPYLLQDLLPVDIQLSFNPEMILLGLLLGILMSTLFAIYPLISTLYVSPLAALRVTNDAGKRSWKAGLAVLLAIFIFILLFAFYLIRNPWYSIAFVFGIVITFGILAIVAGLFMRFVKTFFPRSWGFVPRQSLLNLFRPQNQTLILVLSIGIGTFLISTLYFTKDMLLAQATLDSNENSPNIILLDVQSDQLSAVENSVRDNGLPVLQSIPMVAMRIQGIRGETNAAIRNDTLSKVRRWVLNHEFRSTYRDTLINSEKIVEGEWIANSSDLDLVPISISQNFSDDADLSVGDNISFNVQGAIFNTVVKSIRSVDWSQMQLNFMVVFPEGVLENAPQFSVITTKAETEAVSANLQKNLVSSYPNVSIIDLRQVLQVIEELLNKISWIINFMAFFSILTGIIVLIGAVRTSKYQRVRESVLLRTLGAKSDQILKIMMLEYLFLGLLGALAGILLSLLAMQFLAWQLFDATFTPSYIPFLVILPSIIVLVLIVGMSNSASVIKSSPLKVLRKLSV